MTSTSILIFRCLRFGICLVRRTHGVSAHRVLLGSNALLKSPSGHTPRSGLRGHAKNGLHVAHFRKLLGAVPSGETTVFWPVHPALATIDLAECLPVLRPQWRRPPTGRKQLTAQAFGAVQRQQMCAMTLEICQADLAPFIRPNHDHFLNGMVIKVSVLSYRSK